MGEFRVRKTDDNFDNWTVADGDTFADSEKYIDRQGAVDDRCVPFNTEAEAQAALDLYLSKQEQKGQPERKLKIGDKVKIIGNVELLYSKKVFRRLRNG